MVVDTPNFVELNYSLVAKILGSSDLHVDSEIEVLFAGNKWLSKNFDERRKSGKDLLLKVRLPLLSDPALNSVLNKSLSLFEINECVAVIKEVLGKNESIFQNKSNSYYINRYCNQKMFNILICGGIANKHRDIANKVTQIDGSNLKNTKFLASMMTARKTKFHTFSIKGEVYVIGGHGDDVWWLGIEKYSLANGTWNKVSDIFDDRYDYCVCAFMSSLFMIGGCYLRRGGRYTRISSCLEFDTRNFSWKEVAGLHEARRLAACAVFEENIVVCGGEGDGFDELNTAELFDVVSKECSSMPSMVNHMEDHCLVVVKNKLFAIGKASNVCEVYDSKCQQFVVINSPAYAIFHRATSVGNKVVITQEETNSIIYYDVDKHEWSEVPCEVTNNLSDFSCVKVPWF